MAVWLQRHGLRVERIPTEGLKDRPQNLFGVFVPDGVILP